MAANTDPIYSRASDIQALACIAIAANADSTGGGTLQPFYQADTTNGGFVQKVRIQPIATTATATTATSIRIFLSNITGTWTGNSSSNTWSIGELTLPATTLSATLGQATYEIPLNMAIPAGWRLVCSFGTTLAANTGYVVAAIAGKY